MARRKVIKIVDMRDQVDEWTELLRQAVELRYEELTASGQLSDVVREVGLSEPHAVHNVFSRWRRGENMPNFYSLESMALKLGMEIVEVRT